MLDHVRVGDRLSRDPGSFNPVVHRPTTLTDAGKHPVSQDAPVSPASPPSPPSFANGTATAAAEDAGPTVPTQPLSEAARIVAGEGGEGGGLRVSNAEFVAAVFPQVPQGAFAAVCSKAGDPTKDEWLAQRAIDVDDLCPLGKNNYINCSCFVLGEDGSFRARKERFEACYFLMLDDVGTKVPLNRLGDFKPTWRIETSPGNFQIGIVLAEPITDANAATQLHRGITSAGLCDRGASGPTARWSRLPKGVNGKPKYVDESGSAFSCRLVEWNPEARYTPQEIVEGLGLQTSPPENSNAGTSQAPSTKVHSADPVYTPRASTNPVVAELKARGLYKRALGHGKHDITCPRVDEHTDRLDDGAAYLEPDEAHPLGGFRCHHSHGDQYSVLNLLDHLGVSEIEARHIASITVVRGEIDRVVWAAEKVLADSGRYFQWGGLIASVAVDPANNAAAIVPANASELTRTLSSMAYWRQHDGRSKDFVRTDPPARHIGILCDTKSFMHLPPLVGLARQPYFGESDGALVTKAGYDPASRIYGVFNERDYTFPEPSREAAEAALGQLQGLLKEFAFAEPADKAAALAAMLTAAVRPTLPHAPAFHVTAPASGSGKSYLCELISGFAGPVAGAKLSYPVRPEEATKAIHAALLSAPSAMEFDDMVTDWIAHGIVNRLLTAEYIDERLLGYSKIVKVSTRTLVMASGNNVGPTQDLLRRVLTIRLDQRSETPATTRYSGSPVAELRCNRAKYIAAALTVIAAWRNAGCPRSDVRSIATYGGPWGDYCRHPLIWLGLPDPASALLEQVSHDPDGDTLGQLLRAWHAAFGSAATTVRKALERSGYHDTLHDAMQDLPIAEKDGSISPTRLGQFLRRHANRIVGGLEFRKDSADGRLAWRVVPVKSRPPLVSPSPADPAPAGVGGGPRRGDS